MKILPITIHISFILTSLFCQCYSLSPDLTEVVNPISLEISVYDVSVNSVEIDWHFKDDSAKSTLSCDLVYGPVKDESQVKVFTRIQLTEENIIKLNHLENNMTYHMYMVCHNGTEEKIQSNALQFTTGIKTVPLTYVMPSSTFHHSSIPRENFYSRDEDYARTVRSSSVILGAVCGIVGFLIINVTIVMAVRKYSHRQMRRRRILEIEERDYDEFPYLRPEE
ncbi:hypothetical protein JTE90_004318 [Oedothorax gibbosus]|uniref:Fibronectin type-III domain-containing protein n=1 Tax=Oedothorax gibbosus TaxID=931172 RepID=A0AAV6VM91_9ARAC|nr:hypothetical protein JTE90_004318 [Oedothorax gibbosus]